MRRTDSHSVGISNDYADVLLLIDEMIDHEKRENEMEEDEEVKEVVHTAP
jgi:hypothetical protein